MIHICRAIGILIVLEAIAIIYNQIVYGSDWVWPESFDNLIIVPSLGLFVIIIIFYRVNKQND